MGHDDVILNLFATMNETINVPVRATFNWFLLFVKDSNSTVFKEKSDLAKIKKTLKAK